MSQSGASASAAPPPPPQPRANKPAPHRARQTQIDLSGDDTAGWGNKKSFIRNMMESTDVTKPCWKSASPRFKSPQTGVDKMYDTSTGLGPARCDMTQKLQETPRKYAMAFNDSPRFAKPARVCGNGVFYDTSEAPRTSKASISTDVAHTHRNYRTAFVSSSRRAGDKADVSGPEYDFGDGPKIGFVEKVLTSGNKVSSINIPRSRGSPGQIDKREPLEPEYGNKLPLARAIQESAFYCSSMSSVTPRFLKKHPGDEAQGMECLAEDQTSITQTIKTTPRKYGIVSTSTPRFKPGTNAQLGGRDFYDPNFGTKTTLSKEIATSSMKYSGSIASTTPRFRTSKTHGSDASYDTDKLFKASIATRVEESPVRYTAFRSKVPRFEPNSFKSKLKKLDLDAILSLIHI
eukprot:TRINITY_DN5531_c0_g1_i12.p1 TRINITY_DN5531_c0_g1~~TRINITY_DN5531_c0_g1_i12.p1  ORF type:complete len:404 (+),score=88.34 TRINITY_DN5531_c0_g1_i12:64-1275(+)